MKEFAILHELSNTQFLVNKGFSHDTNEFYMDIKFWAENINGYATITLNWKENQEDDFLNTWNKFKEADYCINWINALNI